MMRTGLVALTLIASGALVSQIGSTVEAQPRPVVERVQPASGPPGTSVQIIGRRLGRHSQILLGNVELPVSQRLPNRWTVTIPVNAPSGPIIIRTRAGDFQGPYFRVTAARPAPVVTSIQPPAAPPGSEVRLMGSNFSARLADNVVFLNNRPVVVRSATPTALSVIIPAGATNGPFLVRVLNAGETLTEPFTVAQGMAITALEPAMGPVGSTIIVRGTGFSRRVTDNRVYLNNRRMRIRRASETELHVQIPPGATSGPILVDVRRGGRTTSPIPFVLQEAPRIDGFSPPSGPPGTLVTIQGANFGTDIRAVSVSLGRNALIVRRVTPNEIQAEIPAGIRRPEQLQVSVHALSATSHVRFNPRETLDIASIDPRSGAPGSIVVIRGEGFDPRPTDNAVFLSGVRAEVLSASPNELRVRVPAAASGPFEIRGRRASVRSRQPFLVSTPPFIASFQPLSGPVGSEVVIRGSNFGRNPRRVRVDINGQQLSLRSVNDSQIVAVIPNGARTGRISVNVGTRGGAVTPQDFVVEAVRQVTTMTPTSGFEGTVVVIRGHNFPRRGVTVQFTGAARTRAQRISPVELRIPVPAGSRTGPVTVLLPNGRSMPAGTFTVGAAPQGTGIQQIQTQCAFPGCQLTLVGHGFSATPNQNRVRFNGRVVPVIASTPTTLTVSIPAAPPGNGTFHVDVRGGGSADSPPFMIMARPRR